MIGVAVSARWRWLLSLAPFAIGAVTFGAIRDAEPMPL